MARPVQPTTVLLQRIRAQDKQALNDLLAQIQPEVEKCVRRIRSPQIKRYFDTLDTSQDFMVDLVRYLPGVQIEDGDTFRRLMFRMVKNTLLDQNDYIKAARRRLCDVQPLGSDTVLDLDLPRQIVSGPSTVVDQEEQNARIRLALGLLPPDEQELVLRHQFEHQTFGEIGKRMGLSEDAARMRFNRTMVKLTGLIGKLRRGDLKHVLDDADRADETGAAEAV